LRWGIAKKRKKRMDDAEALALLSAQDHETPETMITPSAEELQHAAEQVAAHCKAKYEAWLAEYGWTADVQGRACGPMIKNAHRVEESPPVEEPAPPEQSLPALPPVPDLSQTAPMAVRVYEEGILYWSGGQIYMLQVDENKWRKIQDRSPGEQEGFVWLRETWEGGEALWPLGEPLEDEQHGDGCVREVEGITWIRSPNGNVLALFSDWTWKLIEGGTT
jgi:hypothetical protein